MERPEPTNDVNHGGSVTRSGPWSSGESASRMPASAGAPPVLGWLFAVAMLCLPLGMAAVTITFSLLMLGAVAFCRPRSFALALRHSPTAVFALALFGWYGFRTIGGAAGGFEALRAWLSHHELLVLPLLLAVPLSRKQQRSALIAFIVGNIAAAMSSYARVLDLIPPKVAPNSYAPPRGPIGGAWLMSLAAFASADRLAVAGARVRVILWAGVLLPLGVIFFLVAGRTAYLSVLVLAVLLLWGANWRRVIAGSLVLVALSAAAWTLSPYMRERIVDSFSRASDAARSNSAGIRLEFYRVTAMVVRDAPLLGHGTGSFARVYEQKAKEVASPGFATANPHNQYLFLAAETGVPGVLLFVAILASAWYESKQLSHHWARLLRGVVLTMAISCLFNSFLLDGAEGRAFALLVALCLMERVRGVPQGAPE